MAIKRDIAILFGVLTLCSTVILSFSASEVDTVLGLETMEHLHKQENMQNMTKEFDKKYDFMELLSWVNVKLNFSNEAPHHIDPIEILKEGKGRCREFSILYVSACLVNGYQSRLVVGVTFRPSWLFDEHAWAEVKVDDRWVHVDPTTETVDYPLMYEQSPSWGKNWKAVYAFEDGKWEDVTSNYKMPTNGVGSQELYMLFFSILYGIMLNSAMGYGAFPLARAIARRDIVGCDKDDQPLYVEQKRWRYCRSVRRVIMSMILLNILPLLYFGGSLLIVGEFSGSLPSNKWTDLRVFSVNNTFFQVLCIGSMAISVFAFYRFFLGAVVWKHHSIPFFYDFWEIKIHEKKKNIHPESSPHVIAGMLYLLLPQLMLIFFSYLGILL